MVPPLRRRLTEGQKRSVAARYEWKCGMCARTLPSAYQIDHIIPLWAGGEDTPDQCWPLCAECHADKTQRETVERTERRRRIRQSASVLRRCPFECTGCGVVFSPYFTNHACR